MEKGALFPPSTPMATFVPLCYVPCLMGTGFQFPLHCARLTPPRAPMSIHSLVLRVDARQEEIPGLYTSLEPP